MGLSGEQMVIWDHLKLFKYPFLNKPNRNLIQGRNSVVMATEKNKKRIVPSLDVTKSDFTIGFSVVDLVEKVWFGGFVLEMCVDQIATFNLGTSPTNELPCRRFLATNQVTIDQRKVGPLSYRLQVIGRHRYEHCYDITIS